MNPSNSDDKLKASGAPPPIDVPNNNAEIYAYQPPASPHVGSNNYNVAPFPIQPPAQYGCPINSQAPLPPPAGYATQFPYPPQSFADTTVPNYGVASAPTYTNPMTPSHLTHHGSIYSTHSAHGIEGSGYPPPTTPGHHHHSHMHTSASQSNLNSPSNNLGINPPAVGFIHPSESVYYHQAPAKKIELGNPTVRAAPNFNPQEDAEELLETLKLASPNKDILINILCHRNLEQRLEIAKKYNEISGQDMVADIKARFDCNFQKILVALLTPLIDFYVQELNESLEMYDYDSTIDIMCPLSNYEMYTLKYVYQKKYNIPLDTEVRSKTSEHLKRLLLSICACSRDESGITNVAAAQHDARQLASQENPYDDERFCHYKDIFSTRNFQQIKLICDEYLKLTGQPLERQIKNKFIMDDKQGYLCIARYSQDKYGFFAKRLHRSMAGMGTNDNQLIRLVVTRCEIDLQDIKDTFARNFGKSLRSWIKGDTSGHYKYCLYELIGEKRSSKYNICCCSKCCC